MAGLPCVFDRGPHPGGNTRARCAFPRDGGRNGRGPAAVFRRVHRRRAAPDQADVRSLRRGLGRGRAVPCHIRAAGRNGRTGGTHSAEAAYGTAPRCCPCSSGTTWTLVCWPSGECSSGRYGPGGTWFLVGLFEEVQVNEALLAAPILLLAVVALLFMRFFPLLVRFLGGESQALVHVWAGAVLTVLAAAVVIREIRIDYNLDWLPEVALLAGFAAAYVAASYARGWYLRLPAFRHRGGACRPVHMV